MHLGDVLWSLLVFFVMIMYFMMLFYVIVDLFRNDETSGWTKALWVLFLLIFPLLSLIIYLLVNSKGMAERQARTVRQQEDYIRSVAGSSGGGSDPAETIKRGQELLASGAITQQEFEALKRKALA